MSKTVHQFSVATALLTSLIALFLLAFLMVPVLNVVYIVVADVDGGVTLSHFGALFDISLK